MTKPEWRLISIDETANFNILPEDQPFIKEIRGVYCYDATDATYICSAEKMRYTHGLRFDVYTHPNTPEDVRERLNERYEIEGPGEDYMPARFTDYLAFVPFGDIDDDDLENDDGASVVREYWQGNHETPY